MRNYRHRQDHGMFVVGRNPDRESSLPYIVQFPVRGQPVTLKAKARWPIDGPVYCRELPQWPEGAERIERVAVRSARRRGPTIDLVLDRSRRGRSSIIYTNKMILWQSVNTVGASRPDYRLPGRSRPAEGALTITADTREQIPFDFEGYDVELDFRPLAIGDYAVLDPGRGREAVAVVERKNRLDFLRTLDGGELPYQMARLETERIAAIVVEMPFMYLFDYDQRKRKIRRRSREGELAARIQARYPNVPIVYAGGRVFAEEWTYRFLAAAAADYDSEADEADERP